MGKLLCLVWKYGKGLGERERDGKKSLEIRFNEHGESTKGLKQTPGVTPASSIVTFQRHENDKLLTLPVCVYFIRFLITLRLNQVLGI